ncbi:MAG: TonB-dependent receptor [Sphingomonadaceae bacterium]
MDSLWAQLRLMPVGGLTLTGGARHDRHDRFGGETVFAASAAYSPNDGETLLRASWGQGFKAPSLFQLFSDFGNPALAPERADSLDAGIVQRFAQGRAEVSATVFRRLTRGQIDFVSCFGNPAPICVGRPFGTYDNVRRTRATGLELGLALKPTDRLRLDAGYAFLDAENRDTGRRLARRPRDTLTAGLNWDAPLAGLALGAEVQHVGARFDNASNSRRVPGHTLVALRARLPVTDRIELTGRVENLLDETYETVFQYGQPGRAAFLGARLRL